MSGKLSKIYICRKKNDDRESVPEAILDEKYGLVGDYKSESNDKNRQLVIMIDEDRENINKNYKNRGLCTKRFHENILIEGITPNQLNQYDRFKIGESKIEITSVGKRCFEECELVESKEFCPLKERVFFARVVEGGKVNLGDVIIREDEIEIGG